MSHKVQHVEVGERVTFTCPLLSRKEWHFEATEDHPLSPPLSQQTNFVIKKATSDLSGKYFCVGHYTDSDGIERIAMAESKLNVYGKTTRQ